ncbi:hypothetical protein CRENBAI_022038 [Crenichthys baileyi]|uniref:Uncharacterized protein n=1 Tax=Crenichthys baileyi TaxID=28760 RepID=A0AAV9RID2_9TELE
MRVRSSTCGRPLTDLFLYATLIPCIPLPDPGPLCRAGRWTADRGPNMPERLLFSSLGRTMGSAELVDVAGKQHAAVTQGRRGARLAASATPIGRPRERRGRASVSAPPTDPSV